MEQYQNDILLEALVRMKETHADEDLLKAGQALMDTRVYVPAKWDKEPTKLENGKIRFPKDAKMAFMTAASQDGTKMFPVFTSVAEMKNAFGEPGVNCLLLSSEQFLPMVRSAKGDVDGIVVDPAGVNVRFPSDFLIGFADAYKTPLKQENLAQNSNVYLRDLTGDQQDLEAALISAGFHDKAINAIYMKERLKDPNKPDTTLFILVDANEKDTGIFTRLTAAIRGVVKDQELEFMFSDSKLGQDIARTSKPIYVRAF